MKGFGKESDEKMMIDAHKERIEKMKIGIMCDECLGVKHPTYKFYMYPSEMKPNLCECEEE
jgi:hypothetical protein